MTSLLLLSGGIDSAAICYWRKPACALTIDYGQRAADAEIEASRELCRAMSVQHDVLSINCSSLGIGSMARQTATTLTGLAPTPEWWPFRNQLLITFAAGRAIAVGADEILIGTVSSDTCHADGRQEFVSTIDRLLAAQEGGVRLIAPAIHLTSVELLAASGMPEELLGWTHSCHASNFACGQCRGCAKHLAVVRDYRARFAFSAARPAY